jgi:hypothetical protein
MCKYGQAFTGIGTNSHLLQCRSFPDLREAACFNVSFFVIAVYFENACCADMSVTKTKPKSKSRTAQKQQEQKQSLHGLRFYGQ